MGFTSKLKGITKKVRKTATSGAKKAIYAAKVGKAVGGVARDIVNPLKMGKVAVNAVRGKGVVYPGSKYIGPGNAMNKGKPTSSGDKAAYEHDLDYDRLLKQGVKPKRLYLGHSSADQRAMDKSDLTTKHGVAVYGGMAIKKGMYKLGLTGKKIKDSEGAPKKKKKK